MKRAFSVLVVMLMACSFTASAQIWLGGSFGYSYDKNDEETTSTWSVAPLVGYELSDRWAVGAELTYGRKSVVDKYENSSYLDKNSNVYNTFGFKPFVRWSFFRKGIVTLFVDGTLGYTYGIYKCKYSYVDYDYHEHGYESESGSHAHCVSVGIRPGIKLDLTDHLSIEAHAGSLGYSHTFYNSDRYGKYGTENFGLTANETPLNFGIIWKF